MSSTAGHAPPADPGLTAPSRRAPLALVTWALVVLVLLVVVGLLIFKVSRVSSTLPPRRHPAPLASDQVVRQAATVPLLAFDTVGAPAPTGPLPVVLSGQPPLVENGRPEVVYAGSEFCPYCAAARWPLVVALSRFGTFRHLEETTSSPFEVFPGIQTFSFDGTTYRSRYLTWSGVEEYGDALATTAPAGFTRLHDPDPRTGDLIRRYASAGGGAALPFIDIGNRVLVEGAGIGFSPGVLEGASMDQIAADLSDPTNPVAQAVLGTANEITAAICATTGGKPGSVCRSPGVRAGANRLGL